MRLVAEAILAWVIDRAVDIDRGLKSSGDLTSELVHRGFVSRPVRHGRLSSPFNLGEGGAVRRRPEGLNFRLFQSGLNRMGRCSFSTCGSNRLATHRSGYRRGVQRLL